MRLTYTGNTLDFFYDQNGTPFMLLHNSNIYYYITNAQGDVIRKEEYMGTSNRKQIVNSHAKAYVDAVFAKKLREEGFVGVGAVIGIVIGVVAAVRGIVRSVM